MITRKTEIVRLWQQWQNILFSSRARPIRFIITGGIAACVQLGLLHILTHYAINLNVANMLAFLLSAQVNFLLSNLFTWRDRQLVGNKSRVLLQRWITFHGSIAGTAVVNALVFAVAHQFFPTLVASACGILVASFINFFMMNKLIFRTKRGTALVKVNTSELPVVLDVSGK